MNPECEAARTIWNELRALLDCEGNRIREEIASYPTPVAGCDQQFNYLLERRALLSAERTRMQEAETESHRASDPVAILEDFLAGCSFVDATRCAEMTSRLKDKSG